MLQNAAARELRATPSAVRFLALVFGSTWLFQLPAILAARSVIAGPSERFMPLVVLGFFGPLIVALLLSAIASGRRGMRDLLAPLAIWRVGGGWYVLALALPGAIFVAARALLAPVASDLGPWFYPPTQPQQIAAMLLIPFTEQIPWRAYLYPRLEQTQGPLLASLVTGLGWGLFHVQKHAFIGPSAALVSSALMIALMTAGTIVFSWIQLRTRGSLLLVVIAHSGVYLNNSAQALPNSTPLAIHTLGFCAVAALLVFVDRKTWRVQKNRSHPGV